ncbi:MAG TPA: T9SS type A sorting domain-containing protein [candidate division Zixibacteria bacterium]|nr:T9SS type A sorting domain-containing protein [candidate division Zixibacteria bacterium]
MCARLINYVFILSLSVLWPFWSSVAAIDDSSRLLETQQALSETDSTQITWPSTFGLHRTSKYSTSVGHLGYLGRDADPGFEFPLNSGTNYLWGGWFLVGGILGEDTLVSSANIWYEMPDTVEGSYPIQGARELYAADAVSDDMPGMRPFQFTGGAGCVSHIVDTFTTQHGFSGLRFPNFLGNYHRPLHLEITQKSYSVDHAPYRNILLLDYTLTNIGTDTIRDVYFGLHLDPDATAAEDDLFGASDDLTASLRDISTAVLYDNDGNPESGAYLSPTCVTDAIGMRPTRIFPEVSDTNYNWSYRGSAIDFGPRLKGTPEDPFRRFLTGNTGLTVGDEEQYYVLRHKEWDYDQVEVARITNDDPLWLDAAEARNRAIQTGADVRMELSVGAVDLPPGESQRLLFALFCGELVHLDPFNYTNNLLNGDIDRYRNNLYWGLMRETAAYAMEMSEEIVDPMLQPPTSLELIQLDGQEARFRWDSWVFPDVVGYRLTLTPLPRTRAEIHNIMTPIVSTIYTHGREGIVEDLPLNRRFLVTISHVTDHGIGPASEPLLIGDENLAYVLPSVTTRRRYAYYEPGDTAVVIDWIRPTGKELYYYKIYKTTDSLIAANRYQPFIVADTISDLDDPWFCFKQNDINYCYYQMQAYDSTFDEFTTEYYDTAFADGAYYWVSAVPYPGYESPMSDLIQVRSTAPAERDILIVIGGVGTPVDFSILDSIRTFYDRVMDGFDYDLYVWSDTMRYAEACTSGVCFNFEDFARYRLILIEEYANPNILGLYNDTERDLLTRLADAGRNLAYFGIPPGRERVSANMTADCLTYDADLFEHRYLGLDSSLLRVWREDYNVTHSRDYLAGFNAAFPAGDNWPELHYDTSRNCLGGVFDVFFEEDYCLPHTPALMPSSETEIIYRYGSLYPETSELTGLPCGVVNQFQHSLVYCFSFHLWAMEESPARDLISRLAEEPQVSPPVQLPNYPTLSQNYPNPFNAGTMIEFYLPRDGLVHLDIFNLLGQKVRTLLDGEFLRGRRSYRIEWNGQNETGREVATGIYFYRLTLDQAVQTRKMLLIR